MNEKGFFFCPCASGSEKLAADALFYLAGTMLYALAVNIFTAPNNVVPGGVTGVATLLNYLFGLPIGTLIFIINLPLFFLSWLLSGPGIYGTDRHRDHHRRGDYRRVSAVCARRFAVTACWWRCSAACLPVPGWG